MTFTLYTREGCCLCDKLEAGIAPHLHRLRRCRAVTLVKRDIDAVAGWIELYGDRVPVLTHDDRIILEGNPDADEIARAFQHF